METQTEFINEEDENQTELDFLMEDDKKTIVVGQGTFEIPRENKQSNVEENSFRARIKQIRSSKIFAVYYLLIILLCGGLLIWTAFKKFHPRGFIFVCLEGLLTFLLIVDVFMDIIISGYAFFSSWMSVVDLIICFLSTLSFLMYLISPHLSVGEEFENLADLSLIVFWSLTQIASRKNSVEKVNEMMNLTSVDVEVEINEVERNSKDEQSPPVDGQEEEEDILKSILQEDEKE